MNNFLNFLIEYWIQFVFGIIATYLVSQVKKIKTKNELECLNDKHLKEGVIAILHNELFKACEYYLNKDFIYTDEFDNILQMYNSYHNLGGNGTGTKMFEQLSHKPLKYREKR